MRPCQNIFSVEFFLIWKLNESVKMKMLRQIGFKPTPMDSCSAFWITGTPHSWLHEVRYVSSKYVLVKCLYQSLYPLTKNWTQPWFETPRTKDSIGMKSIIITKISFDFVLDYHVNEIILPRIPVFILGKYSVSDHMHWEMLRHGRNLA